MIKFLKNFWKKYSCDIVGALIFLYIMGLFWLGIWISFYWEY